MEDNKHIPVITLISDGPMRVSGNFILRDSDDQTVETARDAFLCRCGKSSRQPFCDGAHKKSCL